MRRLLVFAVIFTALSVTTARAELYFGGFLQGLYGGRTDDTNPTATEYTASETRLQLRMEHFGDNAEFFGRLDFFYDAAVAPQYDWELREGYAKFRLGSKIDVKVGRQILTWGTGDLIFINDVFAKDYRSFFIGRDDQYLKAPQDAVRMAWYNPIGELSIAWTPRFEPNRLPTGQRLSFYNPMAGGIIGTQAQGMPLEPEAKFDNSEIASRLSRRFGFYTAALYFYRGFYKNPVGFDPNAQAAYYPELNVYGASIRGMLMGGILWLEGGYMHSRDDEDGDNPYVPNSTIEGLFGYEKQIASNLTANLQWQVEYMQDYETFESQQMPGSQYRDELYHLLTSRITKLMMRELLTLSGFIFYSPSDEDLYLRLMAEYKYTDEVILAVGANIFDGEYESTEFGQFQKNDNLYAKITYGF
ncbi:MAG: hypothetical protein GF307_10710 [candidate division Zixibacteria bacterium]|nr:hypothetical protein [candidate division Zixibacteria bacterium]